MRVCFFKKILLSDSGFYFHVCCWVILFCVTYSSLFVNFAFDLRIHFFYLKVSQHNESCSSQTWNDKTWRSKLGGIWGNVPLVGLTCRLRNSVVHWPFFSFPHHWAHEKGRQEWPAHGFPSCQITAGCPEPTVSGALVRRSRAIFLFVGFVRCFGGGS